MSSELTPKPDPPFDPDRDVTTMMDAAFTVETPLQDILPGVEYPAPGKAPPQFIPTDDE